MTAMLASLREFMARYHEAVRAAWSIRSTLDPPSRTHEELAFLPAHLELIETPVSPTARWTMRVIIAFFCALLLWATVGRLEIFAVASGTTLASGRTKVIQPLEPAVIRNILVRDGSIVAAGDVLVELEVAAISAELDQVNKSLLDARLAEARYAALEHALVSGEPPQLMFVDDLPSDRTDSMHKLVRSDFDKYEAERHGLISSIAQRRAEAATVRSQLGPLEETLRIARERSENLAVLVGSQYVSRHDYLTREHERVEGERMLAAQRAKLQEHLSAIAAAGDQLEMLVATTRQQTLDELRQAREQVAQLRSQLVKATQRNELLQLRAPVGGRVEHLAIHTVGGVVTEAQSLMAIVPSQDPLEVEATILNKDIGFVRPGQRAIVKVESFPYTRYGYLEGVVVSVSHDAAQDEKLGLVFKARIQLDRSAVLVDGVSVSLSPGMALTVEIRTGTRRMIDYFLSPLKQYRSESLRER